MSDFSSADRNARSRMESMGVPDAPGDPMAGQGKKPMGEVHYRAAGAAPGAGSMPLAGPESGMADASGGSCGGCEYFDGQQTCQLVAGNIDAQAVCDLFEPKGRDAMMAPGAPAGPVGGDAEPPMMGRWADPPL